MRQLVTLLFFFFGGLPLLVGQSSFEVSLSPSSGYFSKDRISNTLWQRNDGTEHGPNYRVGLHYNQRLSTNWYLRTGIRFANLGYRKTTPGIWDSCTEKDKAGILCGFFGFGEFPRYDELIYQYQFIEVPLLLRFQWTHNQWGFFVEAGGAIQYQARLRNILIRNDSESLVIRPSYGFIQDFPWLLQSGLGVVYQTEGRLHFFLQTNFFYQVSGLYKDTPRQHYLWQLGGELGVRYTLNSKS
jgi:hypothetical protein